MKTTKIADNYEDYKGSGVYADLLLDLTFKKAFNPDTQNKVCLIELLNALLEGEIDEPIEDVQSRDKEYSDGSNESRTTIFDLHCVDSKNRKFIIEVQIAKQENIVNRAIYYAAQTVVSQGDRGRGYKYGLDPVITVVFMEFSVFDEQDKYLRKAMLREKDGTRISRTLNFVFVELPKFRKKLEELETNLDKCLYALCHIKELRKMPSTYTGSSFELLFRTAELAKFSKEEQKMIDAAQKAKWDAYAIQSYREQEDARIREEAARLRAEKARVQAEKSRVQEEASRVQAEKSRVQEEASRVQAEKSRVQEEASRVQAEKSRVQEEVSRVQEEASRLQEETVRVQEEISRQQKEAARLRNENVLICEKQAQLDEMKLNLQKEKLQLAKRLKMSGVPLNELASIFQLSQQELENI
ncbi:MAG: Rpn family recombination-promoting nuclease/putative transposase [Hallerella succinigenes]|uniref:Rpn family recombination-promoting nuclease/putative transposase n=1 Tax=Hallerella succinigenes TaxID=1896222 RepID=UPI0023EFCE39|nr:Rpn family recombination-promoting nuclease/putative transposase [Hallerella succinigenes]MDD6091248.1 Rpn family recombination-promoting nuclease/putative transposase [Hallerella succinigenes]